MGALLPLLACSLMMGVVAVGFLAWYVMAGRRSTGERSEVAGLREDQPPPPRSDAAFRRGH